MRNSKVAAKLRDGEFINMTALGHVIPAFIHQAAHFGYDGIWLDLEHRNMSEREVQMLLAYAHSADIDVMIRPPTLERARLYRYLEDGAAGLMIPHCSTAEQAEAIVEAIKFPPVGNRGLDGAGFDTGFLLGDSEYTMKANRETFLFCQIETVEAVKNAEAIAAVEGVDVLFVGPGDLTLRLKQDPSNTSLKDTLRAAVEIVRDACAHHGKKWGIATGKTEELKLWKSLGACVVPWGSDFSCFYNGLRKASSELNSI